MRSNFGLGLVFLAVLVGCNSDGSRLGIVPDPSAIAENCRLFPTELTTFNGHFRYELAFDVQELTFVKTLQALDYSVDETRKYPTLEAFVNETDRVNLGSYLWYEELLDTTLREEREFAADGRITRSVATRDEYGFVEVVDIDFDTWDEHGRPTRGFASNVQQYDSEPEERCEAIEFEYTYDDEESQLLTVERRGLDSDGNACEGGITRQTFDAFGNEVIRERWFDPLTDVTKRAPDSVMEWNVEVLSAEAVCY